MLRHRREIYGITGRLLASKGKIVKGFQICHLYVYSLQEFPLSNQKLKRTSSLLLYVLHIIHINIAIKILGF